MSALLSKLAILADAAKYDASCASSGSTRKRDPRGMGNTEGMGICHSYTPDGRCVSLLKILLTNQCIYDCRFCINRVSSDVKRARFTPSEVVWLTLEFYRRNYIEGLFLSSGIAGSVDQTMEQIVEVARSLREDHAFGGYIHLKVVPGASEELLARAGRHADRISANIELPTQAELDVLAPAKSIATAATTMGQIRDRLDQAREDQKTMRHAPKFAPSGQTTQMIVGATASSDAVLLQRSQSLYRVERLRRVYYSAYSPIPDADAALPFRPPELVRENRLYQADWLMRFYGFRAEEIASPEHPDLPGEIDPKTAWALRNRGFFPVDLNRAPREAMLRVPGLGVKNVDRLLGLRRYKSVTLQDLLKLRVSLEKARHFVVTADHHADALKLDAPGLSKKVSPSARQLSLFGSAAPARQGQV